MITGSFQCEEGGGKVSGTGEKDASSTLKMEGGQEPGNVGSLGSWEGWESRLPGSESRGQNVALLTS
jgi:hypothetical protein